MAAPNEHVLLIRAHRLSGALIQAMARYATVAGHDAFLLYDNDRHDFSPCGLNALLATSDDLLRSGLLYKPGNRHLGLWKNGDYAFYQALWHLPRPYRYYWLIEYDVHINFADLNDFFGLFLNRDEDCLAPYCGEKPASWMWFQSMRWLSETVYGCFFPVLRLSRTALHHCRLGRLYAGYKFRELGLRGDSWPHCEAFVPTLLAQAGFRLGDLNAVAGRTLCDPAWFHARREEAWPLSDPRLAQPDDRLYHPVYPTAV